MMTLYAGLLLMAAHPAAVKPLNEVLLRWALIFSWFAVPAVIIYYLIQIARQAERIARAQERIALSMEATSATLLGLVEIALRSVTSKSKIDESAPADHFQNSGENS